MFKRLKALRLARKAKSKELACLHAMTNHIDCDSLADTCEDNLENIERIMGVVVENDTVMIQPLGNEQGEIHVVEDINDMFG